MEQLSLPYRIALGAIVVFAALYFLVLKKDDSGSPAPAPVASVAAPANTTSGPTAPGVKGLSTAVEKAKGAAATQTKSDAAVQAATGGTTSTGTTATTSPAAPATATAPATAAGITTPGPAAKPAATTKARSSEDPSKPILAELSRGHTAIVLFAGSSASDDQAVRAAVRRANTRGGKVDVHVVPIAKVGAYEAITRGVTVLQSPTTLVIGPKKTARTIVGFTTTAEIDQLAADVGGFNLAAATSRTPAEKRYDRAVTKSCGTGINNANATAGSIADGESFVGDVDRLAARISSLQAPASRKGFQKRFVANLKALAGDLSSVLAARKSGDQAGIDAATAKVVSSLQLVDDEADNAGYAVCG